MVPKFKINDLVEVKIKNNFKRLQILDFEVFENVTLYYTEDGKAYPENVLNRVGTNGLRYFLSATTEQKDKDFLQILKDLKIDF